MYSYLFAPMVLVAIVVLVVVNKPIAYVQRKLILTIHENVVSTRDCANANIEDYCPQTTFSTCGKCAPCIRRRKMSLFRHLILEDGFRLRSGRQTLQAGSYEAETLSRIFISLLADHSSPIQARALSRWTTWVNDTQTLPLSRALLGRRQRSPTAITSILVDFFFRGALDPYIDLSVYNLDRLGYADPLCIDDAPWIIVRSKKCANLEFKCCLARQFPLEGRLINADLIGVLSTILHELALAAFEVFVCHTCNPHLGVAGGGHGEPLARLLREMEMKANAHFEGLGVWDLSQPSRRNGLW